MGGIISKQKKRMAKLLSEDRYRFLPAHFFWLWRTAQTWISLPVDMVARIAALRFVWGKNWGIPLQPYDQALSVHPIPFYFRNLIQKFYPFNHGLFQGISVRESEGS